MNKLCNSTNQYISWSYVVRSLEKDFEDSIMWKILSRSPKIKSWKKITQRVKKKKKKNLHS